MRTYSTRPEFTDKDHKQAVIHVQTWRCFYFVSIKDDLATVVGPGVEHEVALEAQEELDFESQALYAVLRFENGED